MSWLPAIDVSQYQGAINWSSISEPIVIIKMSGGDNGLYDDGRAAANYSGAVAAGKAVGGYHFAGGTDPIAEADFFVRAMSPLAENDVLALDWEIQHADPVGWCRSFINHVHDRTGVWCLIYMNLSTLDAYDWSPVLQDSGLWLADWAVAPDANVPTNHAYIMQQYNDGPWCDHDAVFMTVGQFKEYGYHSQLVPPAPTATTSTTITTTTSTSSSSSSSTSTTTLPPEVAPSTNKGVVMKVGQYNKTILGIVGFVANILYNYNISKPNVYITAIIGILTVAGIFTVPNVPKA